MATPAAAPDPRLNALIAELPKVYNSMSTYADSIQGRVETNKPFAEALQGLSEGVSVLGEVQQYLVAHDVFPELAQPFAAFTRNVEPALSALRNGSGTTKEEKQMAAAQAWMLVAELDMETRVFCLSQLS